MIRVILVDDEPLALMSLEKKLQAFSTIDIKQKYMYVEDLLEDPHLNEWDVLFLDIEMPSMNGIELARILKKQYPQLLIVFVTAYRNYAIQAFESEGLDYLLKPVSLERLTKTIERIQNRLTLYSSQNQSVQINNSTMEIFFFNEFRIHYDGQWVKWKTNKARELLAFFLLHINQPIQRDYLIEILWPESTIESGKGKLHTTISFLRKTLDELHWDVDIRFFNKSYTFNTSSIACDFYTFKKSLSTLKQNRAIAMEEAEQAITLYGTGLLSLEDFSWSDYLQKEVEEDYFQLLEYVLTYYEFENPNFHKAKKYYSDYVHHAPFNELLMQRYIQFLINHNQLIEAQQHYRDFSALLQQELQVSPNFTIEELLSPK